MGAFVDATNNLLNQADGIINLADALNEKEKRHISHCEAIYG